MTLMRLVATRHDLLKKEQVMKRVLFKLMTTESLRDFGKYNIINPELLFQVQSPDGQWVERAAFELGRELDMVTRNIDPQWY